MAGAVLTAAMCFAAKPSEEGCRWRILASCAKMNSMLTVPLTNLLKQRMQGNEAADIVESRLAGWWAYRLELPCLRIWLDVTDEERARRVASRESLSQAEALMANQQRAVVDGERFRILYDLAPEDPEPYTHIIDATSLNASQILEHVVGLLEASQ